MRVTERLRVLFISPLFSPFQIEVAEAVNRETNVDYRIAFGMMTREARGQPHWVNYEYDQARYTVMPGDKEDTAAWYAEEIRRIRPDVLISGQIVGALYKAVLATWRDGAYRLGFWMEPPDFTRSAFSLRAVRAASRVRLSIADFVLAIGDRAERYWRGVAPAADVSFLPYGEDLSACFSATKADKPTDRMHFLFSGQLRPRHNIATIREALVKLSADMGASFVFTFSGTGPEQEGLDAAIREYPVLRDVIRFETRFETWVDRLRPFREHHVFVYPCNHAGWGLVIPEAMAAAMPVITTHNAEAGRFFVRHRASGMFIEPTVEDLVREMRWCIEHPEKVAEMGQRAREAARDGDAPTIARQLAEILPEQAGRPTRRDGARRAAFEMARVAHRAVPR